MRHSPIQRGVVSVEFALCMLIFFTVMLLTMEFARMLYVWTTVQEVTRRAARSAAISDFSDAAAVSQLRSDAVLGATHVPLAPFLTTARLRIEYLSQSASGLLSPVSAMPSCPAANAVNCARDPHGGDCIRYVRASICTTSAGACDPVPYVPMTPLLPIPANVPPSPSLVPAQSLGWRPGATNCS
jgi:hypothetical protein